MKHEFKIVVWFIFPLVFISCSKNNPKIYQLADLTYSNLSQNGHTYENSKKEEYFVVTNPPDNQKNNGV